MASGGNTRTTNNMYAPGDIAVLQFGTDDKWHYAFLTPSRLSTLTFDAGAGTAGLTPVGGVTGNVPVVPVPMSSMSSPVQATINAITAQGGPTWIATLASQSYVAAQIAILTDGSPDALNTFLEAYNRFLVDESAASAVNAALSTETTNRAAADAALATAVAARATANETTATLDFGFATANEGDVARTTVAASWVTAQSRIVCLPSPADSADHSTDETLVEDIRFCAVGIIPGTSFDVTAYAPNGTWGRHNCSILAF